MNHLDFVINSNLINLFKYNKNIYNKYELFKTFTKCYKNSSFKYLS